MAARFDRLVRWLLNSLPDLIVKVSIISIQYTVGFLKKIKLLPKKILLVKNKIKKSYEKVTELLYFNKLFGSIRCVPLLIVTLMCSGAFFDVLPSLLFGTTLVIVFSTVSAFLLILTSRSVLPRYRLDHIISVNWYVLVFFIFISIMCVYVVMFL
jgi:NADH:ubiquinone oxidoreductase subunit H